ncbi:MAG: hypothetical protein A2293_14410 [Elusimicrobia bacterium RIFOXYB2_FULL_49_7]|nr:MAG: hypothetical protein A2293_14410 [Elusimicrobia bacterium RIFOXYB2_FULL_49_7]
MKKILKKLGISAAAGLLVAILLSVFMRYILTDFWTTLENKTYDLRFKLKFDSAAPASNQVTEGVQAVSRIDDIIIIDIDERSMLADKLGLYYKWPRSYQGQVVEYLKSGNNASATFDIHFNDADWGKSEAERILTIINNQKARIGFNSTDEKHLSEAIRYGVNYDRDLVESTRQAGNVIHAMIMNDTSNYANRSDYIARTTEKHRLESNPASACRMEERLTQHLRTYKVLDGAFPALAEAADRIALVNVDKDADGIHRKLPLMHKFRGYTYPVISLQTCLKVMGKRLEEANFIPGQYLDLGKPFYLRREKEGAMTVSYPGINELMIRSLLRAAPKIRKMKDGENLPITEKIVISKDEAGVITCDIFAGTLSFTTVKELNGVSPDEIKKLNLNEPVAVGDATALIRTAEETFTIVETGSGETTFEDVPLSTMALLTAIPGRTIMGLSPKESFILSNIMSVAKRNDSLLTEYVLLKGKTLSELLNATEKDLDALSPGQTLEFGTPIRIPVDESGRMTINYKGLKASTFKTISFYDILAKRVPADYFCGKIFIIGSEAVSMGDIVSAPMDKDFAGLEIHATAINNILNNDFIVKWGDTQQMALFVGLCLLAALMAFFVRPLFSIMGTVLFSLAYFIFALHQFDMNINVDVVRPIIGMFGSFVAILIYRYITEEKDKKFLKATFENYLSPELIDQMYENKQFPSLGGEESVCTAYFTDIQGFSTFSEKLGSPTRLVELLNEYLSGMTDILMAHGGTLDKYIGDAIIAIFGAPMKLSDHADKACITAIGMQNKLAELRDKWKSEGDKWPEIVHIMRMRIGINSGNIVTGNMGSKKRMNYTMMGDPVNLAARLESAAKQYGVFTMFSHLTKDFINMDRYDTRELDKIIVMGKSEPVSIYELLDEKGKSPANVTEIVQMFTEGLSLYKKQEWDKAIDIFSKSYPLEKGWRPDQKTNPSKLYIDRCNEFKANPPGADWDGVYKLKSK